MSVELCVHQCNTYGMRASSIKYYYFYYQFFFFRFEITLENEIENLEVEVRNICFPAHEIKAHFILHQMLVFFLKALI